MDVFDVLPVKWLNMMNESHPFIQSHEVSKCERERKHIKQYGCNLFTLDEKYLTCRELHFFVVEQNIDDITFLQS